MVTDLTKALHLFEEKNTIVSGTISDIQNYWSITLPINASIMKRMLRL